MIAVRPARRSGPAIAALLLAAAFGCERPGANGPGAPDAALPSRGGIKVPLPPGWAARATQQESLVAGPAGRAVLRIALWSGGARALPTPEALREGFEARSPLLSATVIDSQGDDRHSLLVLNVRSAVDGGASSAEWITLLGATRLGEDVFLCSTVPGATEDEVKASAAACGALSRTEGSGR